MQTIAQRKAVSKYQRSPAGQEAIKRARKRYEKTRKARLRAKKYALSNKGREASLRSRKAAKALN